MLKLYTSLNNIPFQVFSASQYGGVTTVPAPRPRSYINYFIFPSAVLHVVGIACLAALWYYLR